MHNRVEPGIDRGSQIRQEPPFRIAARPLGGSTHVPRPRHDAARGSGEHASQGGAYRSARGQAVGEWLAHGAGHEGNGRFVRQMGKER